MQIIIKDSWIFNDFSGFVKNVNIGKFTKSKSGEN